MIRTLAAVVLGLATLGAVPTARAEAPVAKARVGKVGLRITQIFGDTHQALVWNRDTGTHVVVAEGDKIGKYEIVEIDDDQVLVRIGSREVVLIAETPAAPPASSVGSSSPISPALIDPYASAGVGPVMVGAPAPLDPYADATTGTAPIREVIAPPGLRAGTPTVGKPVAAPVDPYAGSTGTVGSTGTATPAKSVPTPGPVTPAKPPAPTVVPAVVIDVIRIESLTLKRGELSSALADFDRLSKDVGFTTTANGVRLGRVTAGTYFYSLGLRTGDVVTAIDGTPLRTLDDAAAVYARLGSAKKLAIAVDRADAHGTLRFALK